MVQSTQGRYFGNKIFVKEGRDKVAYKKSEIVYVNYDPTVGDEFPGNHLSIILKKNYDGNTYKVVPITSSSSGVGSHKVKLGRLMELPERLNQDVSYLSYEQVRTVDVKRIRSIIEGRFFLTEKNFQKVAIWCIGEYERIVPLDIAEVYYLQRYEKIIFSRIQANAFKMLKNGDDYQSCREMIFEDLYKIRDVNVFIESAPIQVRELLNDLVSIIKGLPDLDEEVEEDEISS
ncbi:MAG: type II toxin-antitoxin system PemK/MazF family toxin [Candidatus Delongbacteria bacterium]|nr:type II toxin-antitoxin system PemK/MazF family toxin [Candidatus Delongbacteria bacterium]